MKFYLHYTIWNKGGMIPWICEGIRTAIPKETIIDFTFDNCTDDSVKNFEGRIKAGPKEYGSLCGFNVRYFESTKKLRWPNTNDAIRRFMQSDADVFLSPQDDMKIQDKDLTKNLELLFHVKKVITKIGLVGMRDGFRNNMMFSSNFSHLTDTKPVWIKSGDWMDVDYVNDGPIALNKKAVDEIGYFSEEYWAHYNDIDYCYRSNKLGFKNFVMGAEIVHEKWGNVQPSEVWSSEYSIHDNEVFKKNWP